MSAYKWDAEDYAQHSHAQKRWAGELIARLALTGNEAVLDLGCGDGWVAAQLADALPNGSVVGVDCSPAMIELARRRYPPDHHPNLHFQIMDARALSFEARFDWVFSNAVLHWVDDHRPVLSGLYRSLKPGGKLLLRMGGQGDVAEIRTTMDKVTMSAQWSEYFQGFEFPYTFPAVDEYRVMLKAKGFTIKRLELIATDMAHEGRAGLAGWIRTTWLPYTQRIPENLRESFIETVCSDYLDQVPLSADGKAHVAMVLLEVEANKSDKT
jgi:trans-aconitate methyltransferase